ncbi:MAG: AzlC family ABC transporter permease [Candidatus Rokuibacteriota bacterium]
MRFPDAPGVTPRGVVFEWRRFREGFVAALALVPSVLVYGSVFGSLAVQAGLHVLEVWAMSVLVFAGAAQFVAVPMIAAGASPFAVIVTTYVVNMRHYLMAATLAPAFRDFSRPRLALIAHVLNDESFAITVTRPGPPNASVYLGSAAAIGGAFVIGVVAGTLLGGLIPEPRRWGLDFAFPAVFLALVATQLRRPSDWLVAVGSAGLALALAVLLPGNWHIVIAGLAASAIGALVTDPTREVDV